MWACAYGGLAAAEEKKNDDERDGKDEMESGLPGGLGRALERGDEGWETRVEMSRAGR